MKSVKTSLTIAGVVLVPGITSVTQLSYAAEAVVGNPAPKFSLKGTDGKIYTLSSFKGKAVVLEWSNHECPFVGKHYNSGNMQRLQGQYTDGGVIWFTIVSSAPGKQGYVKAKQANKIRNKRGDRSTAMLLDPDGKVGRMYGAKTTPHMFVIDPAGMLVYAGAIDDTPSTNLADIETATNYVDKALFDLYEGRHVTISEIKPYGCSVKY